MLAERNKSNTDEHPSAVQRAGLEQLKSNPLLMQTLVIIIGLAISMWSYFFLHTAKEKDIINEFQTEVDKRAASLYREISINFETLRSLSILFNSATNPNLERFKIETKKIISRHSSIQGLAWVPFVSHLDRKAFESKQQSDYPGFEFTQQNDAKHMVSAEIKEAYFPVYYMEPFEVNLQAHGFDQSSNPARFETLLASRDSATPQATASVTLIVETISQKGFLAFLPIYSGIPLTVGKRKELLKGFVLGVYRIDDILSSSALTDKQVGIAMKLVDQTSLSNPELLSTGLSTNTDAIQQNISYTKTLPEIWGRKWTIIASPRLSYLADRRGFLPQIVALIGCTFSLLLVFYIHTLAKRTKLIQLLVTEKTHELNLAYKELKRISRTDALTGIANRGQMDEFLDKEWRRAIRNKTSVSFLLIDVDFFKPFNDNYGHPAGDECLKKIARALATQANRADDLVARYGGEEFAVILADTQNPDLVAENCRSAIEALAISHEFSKVQKVVTVSIGVCSTFPAVDSQPGLLIQQADEALYRAKDSGRNRIEHCPTTSNTD